ncbi:MAG: DNA-binding protein, partial [Clostridia bacterium]|nr:DNA-binding protein [Clostridia bacterium]
EIAEQIGISRQGVRDIIKKSEDELLFYEEKLGLAEKLKSVEQQANELSAMSKSIELPQEIQDKIITLTAIIKQ